MKRSLVSRRANAVTRNSRYQLYGRARTINGRNITMPKQSDFSTYGVTETQVKAYYKQLVSEMIKMNADENDLDLISVQLVINSLINKRTPGEVAWAILQ